MTIEQRKYELAKEIRSTCLQTLFYRAFYFRNYEDFDIRLCPLIDEFNYLCDLDKRGAENGNKS